LVYKLSTENKTTILDQKYEIPGLDRLLKQRKLRKLWQEPGTAVNWATINMRGTLQKTALKRWETTLANCEVTPQAMWPIVNPKRFRPKAPSAIHDPLGPIFYPINKVNIIADCLDSQFRANDIM
jgi:hypothetical protein